MVLFSEHPYGCIHVWSLEYTLASLTACLVLVLPWFSLLFSVTELNRTSPVPLY